MLYQPTNQDVTYDEDPIRVLSSGSLAEEIDRSEILSILIRQERRKEIFPFYQDSFPFIEIDLSSVWPRFETKSETSLMEQIVEEAAPVHISEEDILREMVERDFIVRMPPKKRYTIELEVKSIRRGKPTIVAREEALITREMGEEAWKSIRGMQ